MRMHRIDIVFPCQRDDGVILDVYSRFRLQKLIHVFGY